MQGTVTMLHEPLNFRVVSHTENPGNLLMLNSIQVRLSRGNNSPRGIVTHEEFFFTKIKNKDHSIKKQNVYTICFYLQDKDSKVQYLGKIIDCLSFATQTQIQVNYSIFKASSNNNV